MDMQMTNRVPDWLVPVAWAWTALSLLSAAWIAVDIHARRHRHATVASDWVWITSALYLGPFAIALHHRHVRGRRDEATTRTAATAGLPGGSASALAHLIGVPLVIASGLTIAGIDLWVMIIVIGVLAMALLFGYERLASRAAGRPLPVGAALVAAVVTVLAFDVGMGGWMLLLHHNEYMPPATEGTFWFLMQLGIVLGLATGYPAVAWLARRHQAVAPV